MVPAYIYAGLYDVRECVCMRLRVLSFTQKKHRQQYIEFSN